MSTTILPTPIARVTVSGWYEHTDGSVGRYEWQGPHLRLVEIAPSWYAVAEILFSLTTDNNNAI